MTIKEIEKDKYYSVKDFLSVLDSMGLPHSIIWFEKKLLSGYIPKDYILQEREFANRYISGENILKLVKKITKK